MYSGKWNNEAEKKWINLYVGYDKEPLRAVFTDVDETIRDQLIEKCIDQRLRRKLLEKTNATLADLQRIARAHEAVNE